MSHRDRSSEQNAKLKVLKNAIDGDGSALDSLFFGQTEPVFGSDRNFHAGANYPPITSEGVWETIDEVVFELEGGEYWTDLLVFFTGTEINRVYEIRFLVNGNPTGDVISKELKDVDDSINYNTFNENPGLPAGPLTVTCQAMIPVAGGVPSMTVTRWRVRTYKVGT